MEELETMEEVTTIRQKGKRWLEKREKSPYALAKHTNVKILTFSQMGWET